MDGLLKTFFMSDVAVTTLEMLQLQTPDFELSFPDIYSE